MFGYDDSALNTQPYNGTGRYHQVYPAGSPFVDPTFSDYAVQRLGPYRR